MRREPPPRPCPPPHPALVLSQGWEIVSDYYIRQKTGDWVPYSKQLGGLPLAPSMRTSADAPFGKAAFTAHFVGAGGAVISPWHDLPLYSQVSTIYYRYTSLGSTPLYSHTVAILPTISASSRGPCGAWVCCDATATDPRPTPDLERNRPREAAWTRMHSLAGQPALSGDSTLCPAGLFRSVLSL